jgi:hypothetical protein
MYVIKDEMTQNWLPSVRDWIALSIKLMHVKGLPICLFHNIWRNNSGIDKTTEKMYQGG